MTTPRIDAGALHHECLGTGLPVLVMHGGPGWDHTYLRPWLDPLAEHARLVYYDHRGNGRSPEPPDWAAVTHATWAADADALRASLGADRVVVLGHSYGGFVAAEYALAYPERVAGLVLANTAPSFAHAPQAIAHAEARATPEQIATLLGLVGAPVRDDRVLAEATRALLPLYVHAPDAPPVAAALARIGETMRFRAAAYDHAYGVCAPALDLAPRLPALRAPTLVLGGAHDWVMPPGPGAERLAALIPGAELVVFERSGHLPFLEEPERFRTVVGAWLARVVAGARSA